MLNYIRAELYKVVHRPYLWIMTALLLAGEVLLLWLLVWSRSDRAIHDFFSWVQLVPRMLPAGVFAAMLTTDLVFAGQYKSGAMKNEVSFGLPRSTIYLGKLAAMAIVSLVLMVLAMAFYTGGCFLLARDAAGAPEAVEYLCLSLLAALPIWLGAQALNCALCFLLSSGVAAEFIVFGLFFFLSTALGYLGVLMSSGGDPLPMEVAEKIVVWMPDKLLELAYISALVDWDDLTLLVNWGLIRQCWLAGAFWVAVPTALGLYFFQRREIK